MPSDERGYPIIPHEVIEGVSCEGCLLVHERGNEADIICNYGHALISTVPIEDAIRALSELASRETCTATCPYCGHLNTFSGFSQMFAYVCSGCGAGVSVEPPEMPIQ
jgi:DNA-directed RNA polymerase subunit RPC12/RpoP